MNSIARVAFRLSFIAGVAISIHLASADTRPNPYLGIADRNPFGLKPAPLGMAETASPDLPPISAKVLLTGVTSMFGPARALLEITEQQPGKTPVVNKRVL